jgi:hypothetical protein
MHRNDIFFIFLKLFLRSAHQNDPKHSFAKKKKNLLETQVGPRFQTHMLDKSLYICSYEYQYIYIYIYIYMYVHNPIRNETLKYL